MNHSISPRCLNQTLSEVFARILADGKITRSDKNFLLRAMLSEAPLNPVEQEQVRSVFHRLQMGLLRVVD